MPIERIQPQELPVSPLYSHVVRTGNLVFLAGQVAQDARGEIVGRGDFVAQAVQVFENLQRALASVGGDLTHLLKITTYLTDARFRDSLREVNQRYMPADKPASTLVVVSALARPEYLIEIDAIASIEADAD